MVSRNRKNRKNKLRSFINRKRRQFRDEISRLDKISTKDYGEFGLKKRDLATFLRKQLKG